MLRHALLLTVAAALVAATTSSARGQVVHAEPIGPITVVPGQVVDLFFPNEFDLLHHKLVTFDGSAHNIDPLGLPAILQVQFDWLNVAGGVELSPPIPITVDPGTTQPVTTKFEIPFCPERVSIHFTTTSPVSVEGVFTHICQIPEPSTWLLLVLGAGACCVARRRRGG